MRGNVMPRSVVMAASCVVLLLTALLVFVTDSPSLQDRILADEWNAPNARATASDDEVPIANGDVLTSVEQEIERESIPETVVAKSRRTHAFPEEGARLPVMRWSFAKYAATVSQVLESSSFNPGGLSLDEGNRALLQGVLNEIKRDEAEVHKGYSSLRHTCAVGFLRSGRYEAIPPSSQGDPKLLIPSHPEEEVCAANSSKHGSGIVRIDWGDDPELDRKRLQIIDFKMAAFDRVKEFISKNGR